MLETQVRYELGWLERDLKALEEDFREKSARRFSEEMKGLNRWFDVYAFQLGGRKSRKLAVLLVGRNFLPGGGGYSLQQGCLT